MISGSGRRTSFFVLAAFLPLLVFIALSALLAIVNQQLHLKGSAYLAVSVALEGAVFVPPYLFALKKDKAVKLKFHNKDIGQALFLWMAVFLLWQVYMLVMNALGVVPEVSQVELFYDLQGKKDWFVALLTVGFFGPIFEELYFRGFLFRYLRAFAGFSQASFISALVFGLLHGLYYFLPLLVFGLLQNYLVERRNSLDAAIIVHIINNTAAVVFYFLVLGR